MLGEDGFIQLEGLLPVHSRVPVLEGHHQVGEIDVEFFRTAVAASEEAWVRRTSVRVFAFDCSFVVDEGQHFVLMIFLVLLGALAPVAEHEPADQAHRFPAIPLAKVALLRAKARNLVGKLWRPDREVPSQLGFNLLFLTFKDLIAFFDLVHAHVLHFLFDHHEFLPIEFPSQLNKLLNVHFRLASPELLSQYFDDEFLRFSQSGIGACFDFFQQALDAVIVFLLGLGRRRGIHLFQKLLDEVVDPVSPSLVLLVLVHIQEGEETLGLHQVLEEEDEEVFDVIGFVLREEGRNDGVGADPQDLLLGGVELLWQDRVGLFVAEGAVLFP